MKFVRLILLFFFSIFYISCNEEEQPAPAYRQELAEIVTNENGKAISLILDDGQKLIINNVLQGLAADSIYRVKVLYVPTSAIAADLYAAQSVVSDYARSMPDSLIISHPLDLKASWMSPRYLNLMVGIMTGGKAQKLAFVERGLETSNDGSKILKLQLYHDQCDDNEFYTQEVYMSCPLYPYAGRLQRGRDSVELEVNTYKGIVQKTFAY